MIACRAGRDLRHLGFDIASQISNSAQLSTRPCDLSGGLVQFTGLLLNMADHRATLLTDIADHPTDLFGSTTGASGQVAHLISDHGKATPGFTGARGFDRYADEVLPAIQEPLLARSEALVYAIATTPDGYVPTHNRAFSQPPVGDPEIDKVKSRSKRLFNDRTGARCGS